MTIYAVHGIVTDADSGQFVHRNMLDARKFETHLEQRSPYLPLDFAIAHGGDALTIDDATFAAARAARLVRLYGSHVTLFVNGYNIEHNAVYPLSTLNTILDLTSRTHLTFEGHSFSLESRSGKEHFRKHIKRKVYSLRSEAKRREFVQSLTPILETHDLTIPDYLHPISKGLLSELVALGIDIQNHGWTHSVVGSLSLRAHFEDIERGRAWISAFCGSAADDFAVPNGDGLPPAGKPLPCRHWLTLDMRQSASSIPGVIDRQTLLLSE